MTKPIVPINPEGLEEIAESLLKEEPVQEDGNIKPAPARVENPGSYLILPGKTHGTYSYPDILIAIDRVHLGKNWTECQETLAEEGSFMPTPRQYVDFLSHLKSGKVYDGTGARVDSGKISAILDDILTVRDPYRVEWLDAKFTQQRNQWYITYHKIKSNGNLEEVTEPLQECLMSDKLPGISLDYWLKNATSQGLPTKGTENGSLYYWHPRNKAVSGFGGVSGRAGLGCDGGARGSGAGLGVRRQKIFHRKQG